MEPAQGELENLAMLPRFKTHVVTVSTPGPSPLQGSALLFPSLCNLTLESARRVRADVTLLVAVTTA